MVNSDVFILLLNISFTEKSYANMDTFATRHEFTSSSSELLTANCLVKMIGLMNQLPLAPL
jgi:hypothetical protein